VALADSRVVGARASHAAMRRPGIAVPGAQLGDGLPRGLRVSPVVERVSSDNARRHTLTTGKRALAKVGSGADRCTTAGPGTENPERGRARRSGPVSGCGAEPLRGVGNHGGNAPGVRSYGAIRGSR
jgi:hypothetical protein